MQILNFEIRKNSLLAPSVYDLHLEGEKSGISEAGQFVQLAIPSFYLRRPLSVADFTDHSLRLIYKTVGPGTLALSQIQEGTLSLISGLGHGYQLPQDQAFKPLLLGGGTGIPPLFALAKALLAQGLQPLVFLGFNQASEIFLKDEFEELGCRVILACQDGNAGFQGNIVQALEQWSRSDEGRNSLPANRKSELQNPAEVDKPAQMEKSAETKPGQTEKQDPASPYLYACGPLPMLKSLNAFMEQRGWEGQFSMEERMGCGFGACMGCSIHTKKGPQRVCLEGPVFDRKELLWS